MKIKELRRILDEYDENTTIILEYEGGDMELETGDSFKIKNIEHDDCCLVVFF